MASKARKPGSKSAPAGRKAAHRKEKSSAVHLGPLTFACPEQWTADLPDPGAEPTISLQSQGVSFGIVALMPSDVDPEAVVETALDSLRDEHPALEIEELDELELPPSDSEELGNDVRAEAVFFSVDTLTYCWLRGVRLGPMTLFVMLQTTDAEKVDAWQAFGLINASAVISQPRE